MIKFFRHFRQKLIMDLPSRQAGNKTSKYFKYAIGEIVLVVIGILIALQINTWSRTQSDIKTETLSLKTLVQDLEKQSEALDQYIGHESEYAANGAKVLRHYAIHGAFVELGIIQSELQSLSQRRTFNPITTTFEELNSTGEIALIRNETVKREIIRYYNELERVSLIISNNNTNLVDALFNPILMKQTAIISFEIHDLFLGDMDSIFNADIFKKLNSTSEKMLSNPENEMNLFSALEFRAGVANLHKLLYEQLRVETTALTEVIKAELEGK